MSVWEMDDLGRQTTYVADMKRINAKHPKLVLVVFWFKVAQRFLSTQLPQLRPIALLEVPKIGGELVRSAKYIIDTGRPESVYIGFRKGDVHTRHENRTHSE